MHTLVIVRHGQSTWNMENRFTGWVDVDLTQQGIEEAREAGRTLKREGLTFDAAYTSVLKRAIRTLWLVLDEMDLMWLPVTRSWRLNERHYGALQGLNKAETAAKHGEEQVKIWRRSYDVPPPAMKRDDPGYAGKDRRYASLADADIPLCESLADTVRRVVPYWNDVLRPAIASGQRLLIAAHGNSIRALVKHLDDISEKEILELNIPTGIPMVYELDKDIRPIRRSYLGDPATIAKAVGEVAAQGKAR